VGVDRRRLCVEVVVDESITPYFAEMNDSPRIGTMH
jgi:hypothetical protein